ncbi:hypothetical protein [Pseudomonas syringae]|uniref:hypothetical protein n=1 Tax=Pseudomonas syringae TaxID=317 RepID=UPI003204B5EC
MSHHLESMKEEIKELVDRGQEIKEKVEDYRDEAISIDTDYKNRNQERNYIPLDDLPYGEEIIRTEGLSAEIEESLHALESIDFDNQSVTTVVEAIEDARRIIQNADETLEDCTDLPPKEDSSPSW